MILFSDLPYYMSRHTADDHVRRDILIHNCSRGHDRILADGHARQDGGIGTDPGIPANVNRARNQVVAFLRKKAMIQRGEHDIVPDQCAIIDSNAALVQKFSGSVIHLPF